MYRALRAYLTKSPPDGEPVATVYQTLDDFRQMRDDISDEVWNDGIRVVMDSLRNHSTFLPGEKSYLRFVSEFVR